MRNIGAICGLGLGLFTLFGYATHFEIAWRLAPGMPATHPLTALSLVFLGIGLLPRLGARRSLRLAARSALIAVVAIVALRLSPWGTGLFDAVTPFGAVLAAQAAAGTPILMGVNTAHTFMAIAISALLRRTRPVASQILACVALGLLFVPLTGYIDQLHRFYGRLAPLTLAGALMLTVSALCATHRHGFIRVLVAQSVPGRLARVLLGSATAVILFIGCAFTHYARIDGMNENVALLLAYETVAIITLSWILVMAATMRADVIDRHRRAAETRLEQAQKLEALKAEHRRQAQKLEAIGRLAAGVAHDFNNILQGVCGCLDLILGDAVAGTAAHQYAELALGSAQRGAYLTQHLLSYAGKQILLPKQINVGEFLVELQSLLARTLDTSITVELQTQQPLPVISVDPGQLQTALLNLAFNASQAMPGGGKLLLDAYTGDALGETVVIAVTDTGAGMDETTRARAFEPFFTTKGFNGSGLGLSMVQGFVQQSGGRVEIESALGNGTRIEIWLPTATASSPARLADAHPQPSAGRILLVEDSMDVLWTTGVFLTAAGFEVIHAASGPLALEMMASGKVFDALVTDDLMPGMDGLELVDQARAIQPGLAGLVIIGYAKPLVAQTPALGIEILRKPFGSAQLITALSRVLRHEPGPPGRQRPQPAQSAEPEIGIAG